MPNFKRTIQGRDFIFEYLLDKSRNLIAYLITTDHRGSRISFEMEINENGHWKFVTIVPRDILLLEEELAKAIDFANA